ncbi:MAG: transglutaminase family protein [Pseudomonadota bacterium]
MKIRVGYELVFECPQPTSMLLMLNIHYSRASDMVSPDFLRTIPTLAIDMYRDFFGNWCTRILAPAGLTTITADALVNDSGLPDVVVPNAQQAPVDALPHEVLPFLLGSRYCETDKLSEVAWKLFEHAPLGWGRVQAICDFVHQHIAFGYAYARNTKTAYEAYQERAGVCRDFAHLAIALCRCMNIPARYCAGYLGDIGVPAVRAPMDFSGWFEAYLGGKWYTFDARHNIPRIGRILIGRGRDAADVAISTAFGRSELKKFTVWTDEVS